MATYRDIDCLGDLMPEMPQMPTSDLLKRGLEDAEAKAMIAVGTAGKKIQQTIVQQSNAAMSQGTKVAIGIAVLGGLAYWAHKEGYFS